MFRTPTDQSTLSVSSPSITSCREIAEYMRERQIACDITSNYTVMCPTHDAQRTAQPPSAPQPAHGAIETGCRIRFHNHHPARINPVFWSHLRERFGLSCGHLVVAGKFSGCVYDYFRESCCPGTAPKHSEYGGEDYR